MSLIVDLSRKAALVQTKIIIYSYRTERSMVAVGSFILLVASFPSILFASEKGTNVRQLRKTCTVLQYVLIVLILEFFFYSSSAALGPVTLFSGVSHIAPTHTS